MFNIFRKNINLGVSWGMGSVDDFHYHIRYGKSNKKSFPVPFVPLYYNMVQNAIIR